MAIYANITIDQGSDYFSDVTVETYDAYANEGESVANLTDFTARGHIKRNYNSLKNYEFTCSIPNPTTGVIRIELSSAVSDSMKPGRYVYDVEVVSPDGIVTRVIEGQLEVTPSVTKV